MDITRNYHKGDPNSRKASKATSKNNLRFKILQYIRKRKRGATVYEICQGMGLRHQTASARCTELKARGAVFIDGQRQTDTGCYASVLKAKQ